MRTATEYLERRARDIGLLRQRGKIGVISCAEVAMRMTSVRLEPSLRKVWRRRRRGQAGSTAC